MKPEPGDVFTHAAQADLAEPALYRVLHIATFLGRTGQAPAVVVFQAVRPATGRVYVRELVDFQTRYIVLPSQAPVVADP